MAKKIITLMVDDLNGNEDNVKTVEFSFRGKSYTLDLGEKNLSEFTDLLKPYIEVSRLVSTAKKSSKSNSDANIRLANSKIREWANVNGYNVPLRGRLSAEVRKAYEENVK